MPELSRMTGISRHTIFDWQRRNTNPGADKIMVICEALQITPEELLIGKRNSEPVDHDASVSMDGMEIELVKDYQELSETKKKRLLAYMSMLQNMKEKKDMDRNVDIITDSNGKKLVRINDIRFKGKRSVDWDDVKEYLKEYVGEIYKVADGDDIIYIGTDLPDEYTGSRYTHKLKGTIAKAKANASQGIPELLEIAENKRHRENTDKRHIRNAKFGWYRYDSRFALPVYDESGEIERNNIFRATMLIRHAADGKLYLYDILDIKKETSNSLGS
jgi:transcriptional regulator with XRE-family HTH domain